MMASSGDGQNNNRERLLVQAAYSAVCETLEKDQGKQMGSREENDDEARPVPAASSGAKKTSPSNKKIQLQEQTRKKQENSQQGLQQQQQQQHQQRQRGGGKLLEVTPNTTRASRKQLIKRNTPKRKRPVVAKSEEETAEIESGRDQDDNAENDLTSRASESIDTKKYTELIMFCKERDNQESELEDAMRSFLRARENCRNKITNPWSKIEELADTTLSLHGQVDSLRSQIAQARESQVLFKTEAEKWKNIAQRVDVEESKQLRDHKRVVAELNQAVTSQEQECVQLRMQRNLLEKNCESERKARSELENDVVQARAERDAACADLVKWKRAAQSKAQEMGMSVQGFQDELRELRAFKTDAIEKLAAASSKRVQAQGDSFALEKQLGDVQERLEQAYSRIDILNTQLVEKTTLLQDKALELDHKRLEATNLEKKLNTCQEDLAQSQEKLRMNEQGRVAIYKDQEKRLEQAYEQLQDQQYKEDSLKSKLQKANEETRKAKLEASARQEELEDRIASLEGTLNNLLKNMQTIKSKQLFQTAAEVQGKRDHSDLTQRVACDSAQLLEYDQAKQTKKPWVDIDEDTGGESVDDDLAKKILSEKANRIRMEIQAAAEASFQKKKLEQEASEQEKKATAPTRQKKKQQPISKREKKRDHSFPSIN